ncbi:MAG: cold-shock protein [Candidatus Doudnabacteria bacterium]|nr:cold-shock protein [Candidatus Doudnabacteria bacterium]
MNGIIKRIDRTKGYGFITAEGQAKDFFFHNSECKGVAFEELNENDKVTFESQDSPKGPVAVNIQRAE